MDKYPFLYHSTYCKTRNTPWLSTPHKLASIRCSDISEAFLLEQPNDINILFNKLSTLDTDKTTLLSFKSIFEIVVKNFSL